MGSASSSEKVDSEIAHLLEMAAFLETASQTEEANSSKDVSMNYIFKAVWHRTCYRYILQSYRPSKYGKM